MSSADLKGDAIAVFTDYRELILGLVGAAVVLVVLFVLFGGRVLGGLMFIGYTLLWLAVVAFVLWMFYRLVIAVERIAGAQERIASVQFKAELEENADSETGTDETGADETGTQATFGEGTDDESSTDS